jgi:dethiobiotin synthetase
LGTINHTLLTLEAIESAGIPVAGIVLTGAEDPGLARSLQVFTATPILAEIPLLSSITPRAVQQLGPEYFSIPILNQIFCPLFRA